jgi:hypothetical protein
MMERLERHNALLLPVVAHFDGKIVKSIGDAFLVVFESPTNALQCGMLMQHRLRVHNEGKPEDERIDIKVSLNTGEVAVTETDVFGDPVNVAAKIEKATQPGEIYFTEATFLAMNKAEVPNAFVKTFRPRGADSDEIKLFKVVQDEDDPVYRHVVDDTKIDEAATREKAKALATVAEREVGRWQDALDHLSEGQRKMTRTLVVTVALAVVVLGAAVVAGLYLLRGGSHADPERDLAAQARQFLAAGKSDEARRVVDDYIVAKGHSPAVDALRDEVRDAACAAVCLKARELLASGKDVDAVAAIKAAHPGGDVPAAAKVWLARAEALGRARERLAAGDAAAAREAAKLSAGDEAPTGEAAKILARADAMDGARKALEAPEAERGARALDAIAALSQTYGDDTGDAAALDLLGKAVAAHLFAVARDEGPTAAKARIEEFRKRFKNLTAWTAIRRETDLGSVLAYAHDPDLRRVWRDRGSDEVMKLRQMLREAAGTDAEFWFRLGQTFFDVSAKNDLATLDGMAEVEKAIALDPKVLDRHDAAVLAMVRDWLGIDLSEGSFPRRLAAERYFDQLKASLTDSLSAMYGEGSDARPDGSRRANALAVLVARGEPLAIKDRVGFLDSVLSEFVEGGENASLQPKHARALFTGEMEPGEYQRLDLMLKHDLEQANAKEGPFGAYVGSPEALDRVRKALHEAQPAHAGK